MSKSNLRSGEKHGITSACAACDEVFCGVAAFDEHRVGEFSQDFGKGGKGRHCLSRAEMDGRGFAKCQMGRWSRPGKARTRAISGMAA